MGPAGAPIARTAARISEQRLDARVGLHASGPRDELVELADTFDAMLDRIASTVETQKCFVANASHELRTPLTVIRTGAEPVTDDRWIQGLADDAGARPAVLVLGFADRHRHHGRCATTNARSPAASRGVDRRGCLIGAP